MSDREDIEKTDDSYKILYTTFLVMGVFVFFWLLIAVFNEDDVIQTTDDDDEKG